MTFTISSKDLAQSLETLSKVINPKNSLPILGNISFGVKNNTLSLRASDGENTLMTSLELTEAEGEGIFSVGAKEITEAVKNISERPLTFDINTDNKMAKVIYLEGEFTLPIDLEDLPQAPVMDEYGQFTIGEGLLKTVVERSLPATATDELRPVMNGVEFNNTEHGLDVVASDGHKLIKNTISGVTGNNSFIMPKKPATLLKSMLNSTSDKTATITFDDRQGMVKMESYTLQFRMIEGRYPNYNAVIPENNDKIALIDRTTLLAAMKRITPFANDSSSLVKFTVENNSIILEAEDYDFSKTAKETVACSYNCEKMEIGFKGTTITELLTQLKTQEVELQLADKSRAALIVPSKQDEDNEVTMLLMPMLIA